MPAQHTPAAPDEQGSRAAPPPPPPPTPPPAHPDIESLIEAATENYAVATTLADAAEALGWGFEPDKNAEDADAAFAGQVMDENMCLLKADWQSERDWEKMGGGQPRRSRTIASPLGRYTETHDC